MHKEMLKCHTGTRQGVGHESFQLREYMLRKSLDLQLILSLVSTL